MKIGLILECQPDGPDEKVLRHLLSKFAPSLSVDVSCQGNKENLVNECAAATRDLFDDGCDRVLIIWDIHPAKWGDFAQRGKQPTCLGLDRARIHAAFEKAAIPQENVHLVAIHYMLESWFLADRRAIAAHISKKKRKIVTAGQLASVDPSTQVEAKDMLAKIYEQQGTARYKDHTDAIRIAEEVTDLDHLKRNSPSAMPGQPSCFERFWNKATGP